MAAAACPIARRRRVLILPGSFHSPDSTSTSSLTALRAGPLTALGALTRRGLVIGRDDAAHQLMADHIGRRESNVADALDVFE